MNRWAVLLFFVIIAIFGTILYITGSNNKITESPLPPGAEKFNAITPSPSSYLPQQAIQGDHTAAKPTFGVEEGVKASYSATIKTTKGTITAVLFGDAAPNIVKNFTTKAKNNFYTNLTFHRVEDWVIQGGDPKGDGSGGGVIQTELSQQPFVRGSLGIARGQDIRISNDSQFFIVKQDASWLNQQYTNFGMVTDGMDVVDKIKVGDKILGITINE